MAICLPRSPLRAQQLFTGSSGVIFSTEESNIVADTTIIYSIREIVIEGTRRTRDKVVLRELPFAEGERYDLSGLMPRCHQAKQQLLNTGLFQSASVSVDTTAGNEATIYVSLKERWYLFPVPFADVVDGKLQQWARTMDFNRLNYGVRLKHKNISGLNDRLYIDFINGYTKGIGIRYEGLPLDHALNWTGNFSFSTGRTRDIVYATEQNRLVSFNHNDRFVYNYTRVQAGLTYRPAIKTTHSFGIGYTKESFTDSVGKMNNDFANGANKLSYPEVFYQLHHRDLDYAPYPTSGREGLFLLQRRGINSEVNLWQLTARTAGYWPLNAKSFINVKATGILKLPFEQPYRHQAFVGHNQMFLQGYEDYIIDGVAGGFTKASYHRLLIDRHFHIPSQRFQRINDIPVRIFAKAYSNAGYIYNGNPGNSQFNNCMLYSGGLGLDIILFYDFTLRFEYSVNHLGQNGLYLHDRNSL
jgi:outer membrane protein assembly factor BamA